MTLTSLAVIAQAHAYLGQSNFEQAINSLALALDIEPANREAKEILGIAEIEGGDVDKGRKVSPRPTIQNKTFWCTSEKLTCVCGFG